MAAARLAGRRRGGRPSARRAGDAARARPQRARLLDLSEQETAGVLDIPVGTVKSRTARALERLRGTLEVEA